MSEGPLWFLKMRMDTFSRFRFGEESDLGIT